MRPTILKLYRTNYQIYLEVVFRINAIFYLKETSRVSPKNYINNENTALFPTPTVFWNKEPSFQVTV